MQIARRVYPDVINYKLETLVRYKQIRNKGSFHRALADAEMTAELWNSIVADLKATYQLAEVPFELMKKIARMNKDEVPAFLEKTARETRLDPVGKTGSLFG